MGQLVHICMRMAEGIKIYSQNCRGPNVTDKRRDVFHYVRQKKYDIICLQDVYLETSSPKGNDRSPESQHVINSEVSKILFQTIKGS